MDGQDIQTVDANRVDGDHLLAKVSRRLLPFIFLLYVISYLDRINISYAALQMNADLHLSDQEFGLGAGIFFFGYCAFGIPSNLLIQKLGPRRWIGSIMIAWGAVTLLTCLVRDRNAFCALRLLLGITEAGFFPGMLLYLTYWFPPARYGLAVARFMTAVPLAGIVGSLMAGVTLSLQGAGGLAGWKWLFIITGMPAILFGISVFFVLADRPSQAKWLSEAEKIALENLTGKTALHKDVAADQSLESGGQAIAKLFTNLSVWHFALLYCSMSACMYGFQFWLPQIVQSFGQNTVTVTALLSAIPAVFQGLGMYFIAESSDKKRERRWHIVFAAAVVCSGLLGACILTEAWMRLAALSLAAFGIWGSLGPFWAMARAAITPAKQATSIAFINSIGGLGGFLGPWLVGLVKHFVPGNSASSDFVGALVLLSATALLTAILALTCRGTAAAGEMKASSAN